MVAADIFDYAWFDDDEVTVIHVRGIGRAVLTSNEMSDFCRDAPKRLVRGVYDMPTLFDML